MCRPIGHLGEREVKELVSLREPRLLYVPLIMILGLLPHRSRHLLLFPPPPTPPAVPEVASGGAADVVQCAAEQSFTELGLGSHTPVGFIQNLLEFMHVDLGLPWWGAIAICESPS